MDNQHRQISGCRELSQQEIDLMNRLKAKGAEMLALQGELQVYLTGQLQEKLSAAEGDGAAEAAVAEAFRFTDAEPLRWAAIGKADIQTGIMALVRAVAQPAGV